MATPEGTSLPRNTDTEIMPVRWDYSIEDWVVEDGTILAIDSNGNQHKIKSNSNGELVIAPAEDSNGNPQKLQVDPEGNLNVKQNGRNVAIIEKSVVHSSDGENIDFVLDVSGFVNFSVYIEHTQDINIQFSYVYGAHGVTNQKAARDEVNREESGSWTDISIPNLQAASVSIPRKYNLNSIQGIRELSNDPSSITDFGFRLKSMSSPTEGSTTIYIRGVK